MKARNQKDLFAGFVFIIAGACFAYVATGYELGTAVAMGPGYFPFGLGLVLAALGVAILAAAFASDAEGERVDAINLKVVACIVGSVVLFGALLQPLGLVASIFVLVCAASFGSHELGLKRALLTAAVLSLLCVGVFIYALRVQIPVWPSFLVR